MHHRRLIYHCIMYLYIFIMCKKHFAVKNVFEKLKLQKQKFACRWLKLCQKTILLEEVKFLDTDVCI